MLTRLLHSAAAQAYCNCHTETQRLLCKSSTPAQGTPKVQVARQDGSGGCGHRVICSFAPGIATLGIKLPKPLVESCAAPPPSAGRDRRGNPDATGTGLPVFLDAGMYPAFAPASFRGTTLSSSPSDGAGERTRGPSPARRARPSPCQSGCAGSTSALVGPTRHVSLLLRALELQGTQARGFES